MIDQCKEKHKTSIKLGSVQPGPPERHLHANENKSVILWLSDVLKAVKRKSSINNAIIAKYSIQHKFSNI